MKDFLLLIIRIKNKILYSFKTKQNTISNIKQQYAIGMFIFFSLVKITCSQKEQVSAYDFALL